MDKFHLFPVLTDSIEEIWPEILPWAEEFCRHSQGSYDPPFILEKLNRGMMQLWLVKSVEEVVAVVLTEIRQTKLKECVIVVTTGRNMKEWIHLLSVLERYAKLMGCDKMVGISRPGWENILKPYGYRKKHVELERNL